MSEQNSIYDIESKLVGRFRLGVAWSSPERNRLGEYDDEFVYGNDSSMLAKVNGNHVFNIIGEELGYIQRNEIFVFGEKVGHFIGSAAAGTAAIALIFNNKGAYGS